MMAMSYSPTLMRAVIEAWDGAELSKQSTQKAVALPQNFGEALRLAATLEEERLLPVSLALC